MKNQVDSNDKPYIDPKTGSGYVPVGNNNMDFSIVIVLGILFVVVIGSIIFLFTNDNISFLFNDGVENIVESFVDSLENDYDDLDYEDMYEDYYDELPNSTGEFKEINARDIEFESRNKIIVLWIGSQTCRYCSLYAPVIEEVTDEFDMIAHYIDLGKIIDFESESQYIIDETAYDIIINLQGSGEWSGFAARNIGGMPLTLIIKDNEIIGGVSGFVSEGNLTGIFFDAGLVK